MVRAPSVGATIPAIVLAVACATLFILLLLLRPHVPDASGQADALDEILLWDSLLPRAAIALISGAALGLAGALLQRVLRNPIADASTLGIASGAQLALTLGLHFSPVLLGLSRELVAFAGGLGAIVTVLALAWRRGLDPVTVAICGMIVSMVAASLSVTLVLASGEYAMSIHIWGAGALNQQDWSGVMSLAPRLAAGLLGALLLLRPLNLLALDDASAKGLGISLHTVRFAILLLAVWLSASVTATVGIIGFLGLAAPAIARLCGARTTAQVMTGAPLTGAALLFLTDCLTQLLGPGFSDLAPTGAATALIGGPLLLWLLPRIRGRAEVAAKSDPAVRRNSRSVPTMLFLGALLTAAIAGAVAIGPTEGGWNIATGGLFFDLLPFRLPRVLVAVGAGAMLGAAGFLMQRMTGNPLASPEVLGVSSGAGAGLTVTLFLFAFPSPPIMIGGMALGALVSFLIMIAIARRAGLSAEALLLAGVAISAFCLAIISMVLAQGDMRSYILLNWISGSTSRAGNLEAWTAIISVIVLATPLFLMTRWFAILPLGTGIARSIGVRVTPVRLLLAMLAALMTAIASFLIGPLSLTGLIAPHLSRLLGLHRGRDHLLAAMLTGACLLVFADWLSRIVIYPYQVPVGLFAALIGGPYLLWLLARRRNGASG
ncbi:Fe(3+)-hydroxamate ABC transporter permease FhuB [Rhizobium cauense]|uniref:Fe(3+)-hydroxamate ABC transporter permease FhuB n=1 Tax=Rhizobium cauense TaxID=1166683 RepID=UPI001C6E3CDF|nr:Fe(3+)-hydroxamate ABC transporter permease FhuB [Rhizobium cauense]MBW9117912.1 Fe(3+)-hydroxamate ABC transporter permease FhuB [Rhizobium cauense]